MIGVLTTFEFYYSSLLLIPFFATLFFWWRVRNSIILNQNGTFDTLYLCPTRNESQNILFDKEEKINLEFVEFGNQYLQPSLKSLKDNFRLGEFEEGINNSIQSSDEEN